MYKRIISVFLALLMLLSLCACRRKNPAEISESFVGTPVAIIPEEPSATPAPTATPDDSTSSPQPTLNWVESEDGNSMTATVPTEDGKTFEITLGVGESDSIIDDDSGDSGTANTEISAPATPTPLPLPETTPIPTQNPTEPQAPITDWTGPDLSTTYAEYEAMDGTEQLIFYYSFASAEAFYEWYNAALAEHEANSGDIIIDLP